MFTGIVERMGRVHSLEHVPFGVRLEIEPIAPGEDRDRADASGVPASSASPGSGSPVPAPSLGDSIAVNGCCLTVAEIADGRWRFDVIRQTLEVTTLGSLRPGGPVNLETSATPSTLLGGHLVQGHVDGVGEIVERHADDEAWRLRIAAPEAVRIMLIDKGSITVDGVSLTIADIEPRAQRGPSGPAGVEGRTDGDAPRWFEVALIPTTLKKTTLAALDVGDRVNLESDCLVRMVAALLPRLRTANS